MAKKHGNAVCPPNVQDPSGERPSRPLPRPRRVHDPVKALQAFEARLPTLLGRYPGRFVLYCGPDFIGVFSRYEDAVREGLSRFRESGFLVRQVNPPRPPPALLLESRS